MYRTPAFADDVGLAPPPGERRLAGFPPEGLPPCQPPNKQQGKTPDTRWGWKGRSEMSSAPITKKANEIRGGFFPMREDLIRLLDDLSLSMTQRRIYEWCLVFAIRPSGRGSDVFAGKVRHDGRPVTAAVLARLIGDSRQHTNPAVNHLVQLGLLSKNENHELEVVEHVRLWNGSVTPVITKERQMTIVRFEAVTDSIIAEDAMVTEVVTTSNGSGYRRSRNSLPGVTASVTTGASIQHREVNTHIDSRQASADAESAAEVEGYIPSAAAQHPDDDELDEIFGTSYHSSTSEDGLGAERSDGHPDEAIIPAVGPREAISWDQPRRYSDAELGVPTRVSQISDMDERYLALRGISVSPVMAKKLAGAHSLHEVLCAIRKAQRKSNTNQAGYVVGMLTDTAV
jgi:hypothetical protein